MAVACFFKLSASTQTAWLFAPAGGGGGCARRIVISEDFMGAVQTRKPLKRLDLNFIKPSFY